MSETILLDETPILIKKCWGMSLEEALKHIGERKEKDDEEKKETWMNQRED